VVACLSAGCGSPPADRLPGPRVNSEVTVPVAKDVRLSGTGFAPSALHLSAGQAIRLLNDSSRDRRIVGEMSGDVVYDTGVMRSGDHTVIRFSRTGVVSLHDQGRSAPVLEVRVAAAGS
jgi:hypothetical protein